MLKIRVQVFNFLSLRNGPELLTWGDLGGFLVLQRSQAYLGDSEQENGTSANGRIGLNKFAGRAECI